MKRPLVSIVMATYNGEKFLKKQINSILNQTYSNFELIICDDNSTDNTKEILKKYAKKDSRIKLFFNNKNIGVNRNFEQGIKLTKGEYIAISDQDDIWLNNKLEFLLKNIGNNILIYHDDYLIDENDKVLFESYFKFLNRSSFSHYSLLRGNNFISGHSLLFDATLKEYLFPFPPKKYINYYDYWIVLVALKYGQIKFLNKSLVYWRQHSNNESGNKIKSNKIKSNKIKFLKYKWRLNRIRSFVFLREFYANEKVEYEKYLHRLIDFECNTNKFTSLLFLLSEYKNLFPYTNKVNCLKKFLQIPFIKAIDNNKLKRIFNWANL